MANTTKAKLEARIAELERELAAKPKSTLPPRHVEPWYDNDDECLRSIFRRDPTPDLRVSAKTLGRTPYAVFLRAFKLGLTNEENVYTIWFKSTRPIGEQPATSRPIRMERVLGAPYTSAVAWLKNAAELKQRYRGRDSMGRPMGHSL